MTAVEVTFLDPRAKIGTWSFQSLDAKLILEQSSEMTPGHAIALLDGHLGLDSIELITTARRIDKPGAGTSCFSVLQTRHPVHIAGL